MEDFLHGAQIGRVSEEDVAGKRNATLIRVSVGRNDDLANRVGQVIRVVASDAVLLGLVPPDNDRAVVLVGLGGHDHGDDLLQEVVTLQDVRSVAGYAPEPAGERGVLIVELVRRDPVVLRHGIAA